MDWPCAWIHLTTSERVTEITQEVKAVRDLRRLRCAFGRTPRIIRRAITRNDFDPWVCSQPCRHRLGRALWQEIDRPMLFEIHEDRAIDPPLAERKIIDAQNSGRGLRGRGGAMENAPDRIATEGHPEASGHPGAGFAARLTAEDADGLGEPHGALCVGGRELGEAFSKRLAGTRGRQAVKAADMHAEAHGEYRKIKRPFPPTASASPMPLCSRWCPRLASARTLAPPTLARTPPGRARGAPRPWGHPAPQGTARLGRLEGAETAADRRGSASGRRRGAPHL